MKTVVTYVYSVKMKIMQHVSALLHICMRQRCRYEFKSMCENCKLAHFCVFSSGLDCWDVCICIT